MFSWINANDVYSTPPTVHGLIPVDGLSFVKSQVDDYEDPWLVAESISFEPDTLNSTLLSYWEDVVTVSHKQEHGTLMFGVYRDSDDANMLWTVAAYESEEYLADVHARSSALGQLESKIEGWRTATTVTLMKKRGGFLHRKEDNYCEES